MWEALLLPLSLASPVPLARPVSQVVRLHPRAACFCSSYLKTNSHLASLVQHPASLLLAGSLRDSRHLPVLPASVVARVRPASTRRRVVERAFRATDFDNILYPQVVRRLVRCIKTFFGGLSHF